VIPSATVTHAARFLGEAVGSTGGADARDKEIRCNLRRNGLTLFFMVLPSNLRSRPMFRIVRLDWLEIDSLRQA